MPFSIACPKCQKRFQLPDATRGKKVKCPQCQTVFRAGSKPAGPPAVVPAQAVQKTNDDGQNLSDAELSQYGIEGNLARAPEIFSGGPPPPQAVAGLGNFAGEDPGFGGADFKIPDSASVEADSTANPYAAVLNNPALRPAAKKKKKKNLKAPIDYGSYRVAVYGMNAIFWAGVYVLLCSIFLVILGLIVQFAPDLLRNMLSNEGFRNVVLFLFQMLVGWGLMACMLAVFIGQVLCMFAPKSNERLNAGLAIAVIVVAVILMFASIIFFGVLGAVTGADPNADDAGAAGAVIGLGLFLVIGVCWLLALSSFFFFVNFYRKVGQNIDSKDVVGAANVALITWIAGVALGVIVGVTSTILISIMDDPETILRISQISGLLNFVMSVVMMATWLNMVQTTITKLAPR